MQEYQENNSNEFIQNESELIQQEAIIEHAIQISNQDNNLQKQQENFGQNQDEQDTTKLQQPEELLQQYEENKNDSKDNETCQNEKKNQDNEEDQLSHQQQIIFDNQQNEINDDLPIPSVDKKKQIEQPKLQEMQNTNENQNEDCQEKQNDIKQQKRKLEIQQSKDSEAQISQQPQITVISEKDQFIQQTSNQKDQKSSLIENKVNENLDISLKQKENDLLKQEVSQLRKQNKSLVNQLRELNDKLSFILKSRETSKALTKGKQLSNNADLNLEEAILTLKKELDNAYKLVNVYQKENKKLSTKVYDNQQVYDKIMQLENVIAEKNKQVESLKQELKTVQKISRNLETALSSSGNNHNLSINQGINLMGSMGVGINSSNNNRYMPNNVNNGLNNNNNSSNNVSLFFEKSGKNKKKTISTVGASKESFQNDNKKLIERIKILHNNDQSVQDASQTILNDNLNQSSNHLLKDYQENYQSYSSQTKKLKQKLKEINQKQQQFAAELMLNETSSNNNINQTVNSISCDEGGGFDFLTQQVDTIQSEQKDCGIISKQQTPHKEVTSIGYDQDSVSKQHEKFKSQISSDEIKLQYSESKNNNRDLTADASVVDDLKKRVKDYHQSKIGWEKKYRNEIKSYQTLIQQQQDTINKLQKKLHIQNLEQTKLKALAQQQIQQQFQQQQLQQLEKNEQRPSAVQVSVSRHKKTNSKAKNISPLNSRTIDSYLTMQQETPHQQQMPQQGSKQILSNQQQSGLPQCKLKSQKQRELSSNNNGRDSKNQNNTEQILNKSYLDAGSQPLPLIKPNTLNNKSFVLPQQENLQPFSELQEDTQFIKNKIKSLQKQRPQQQQFQKNQNQQQQQMLAPIQDAYPSFKQEKGTNKKDIKRLKNIQTEQESQGHSNQLAVKVSQKLEIATSTRSLITNINEDESGGGQRSDNRSPEEKKVANILKGIIPLSLRDTEFGKDERYSKRFTDKVVLKNNFNARIIKLVVWFNELGIAGVQASYRIYPSNNVVEGNNNVIQNTQLQESVWEMEQGDYLKYLKGTINQEKHHIIRLMAINNQGEQRIMGLQEEDTKENQQLICQEELQFILDIGSNEVPICLHGALNALYDDEKDQLSSQLCLIGVQVVKDELAVVE